MKKSVLVLILLIIITACAPAPKALPTAVGMPFVTATMAVTHTPTPTCTYTPEPSITPTIMMTPTLSASLILQDFTAHKQLLALDCESAAAVDWAKYLGVTIDEYEFQHGIPISDNPDIGFVGYSTGPWGQVPPYAYGVHAGPIADRLQQYGLNAVAVKGATLEQVKRELAAGRPVIVWVIGNCVGGIPYEYTDTKGNKVTVAAYEHVIILYGFDGDNLYYFNVGKRYMIPSAVFQNSWGVLGNMVIVLGN
jgi:uncharacterized protein YvpB